MGRIACAFVPRYERQVDGERERAVLMALGTLSPLLDADGRGAFFLGLDGLERIITNEAVFAARVKATLATWFRDEMRPGIAVADDSFVAWVAAQRMAHGATRGANDVGVIAPGQGALVLERVPISSLALSQQALELLSLLGVRTAAALGRLPAGSLARRLGAEGEKLAGWCRGDGLYAWPRSDLAPAPDDTARLDLDEPVRDAEPLLFLGKSLLDRVLAGVRHRRLVLAELTVRVRLDDRSLVVHRITPARPTMEAAALLDLFRLWLDGRPLRAAVTAIELAASGTDRPSARQMHLLDRRREEQADAIARAAARLVAAFGEDHVTRSVLRDRHRPESRLAFAPWSGQVNSTREHPPSADAPVPAVLRLLSPPEPVLWHPGEALRRPGHPALPIVGAEGPHRLAGEWWDAPFDRTYHWLSAYDGTRLWVFRDERDGRTYLHAVAD